ncbi:MAG: antitoxin component YwqK of YwqJK toxin-antitoxin module [Flavobacteriales bacterium]|jgi:antitoxin component YwqK of YwqJK toxin-antitoxin module
MNHFLFHHTIISLAIIFTIPNVLAQNDIKQNGHNKFYGVDGKLTSEGNMINGEPDGVWKTYYKNGRTRTAGKRTNFLLDSIWDFYNEEGFLTERKSYTLDDITGYQWIYDTEGILLEKIPFEKGIKKGEYTTYYPSGNIKLKAIYINNRLNKDAVVYADDDGRKITLLSYKDDLAVRKTVINRYNVKNEREGLWILYYDNDQKQVEGNYTKGLKNGVFKYYDKKGNLTQIVKYVNGVIQKDDEQTAVLKLSYTYYPNATVKSSGSYSNGNKVGIWRYFDEQGNITSSEVYERGFLLGEGIVDEQGYYQGYWKHYYDTGELLSEGHYIDGKKDKLWKYYFLDGKIEQQGYYRVGKTTGDWILYYQNGAIKRKEEYSNDLEEGEMIAYDEQGAIIAKGMYIEGEKDGEWYYKLNDFEEKGSFINGEPTGLWVFTYENGRTAFKGEYVNGIAINKHTYYHANGTISAEGKYSGGTKKGDWKWFDEEGRIYLVIRYKKGKETKINGVKVRQGTDIPEVTEVTID